MIPRWFQFSYLVVLLGAIGTTSGMGWALLKSQAQARESQVVAADRLTQREACWKLYSDEKEKLSWFQDSCRGMNCNEVFSNDAAGVVTATYTALDLSVATIADMCHYDERVNLGQNYPGAKLVAFGLTEGHSMGKVNGEHLVHCDWVIPSHTWCQKE